MYRYNEKDKKFTGISLTTDHSPSEYAERIRIQKAGGQVRLTSVAFPQHP